MSQPGQPDTPRVRPFKRGFDQRVVAEFQLNVDCRVMNVDFRSEGTWHDCEFQVMTGPSTSPIADHQSTIINKSQLTQCSPDFF